MVIRKEQRIKRKKAQKTKTRGSARGLRQQYVLESTDLPTIRAHKNYTEKRIKYEWDYYWELEGQRKAIKDDFLKALNKASVGPIEQQNWQRAVPFQYSGHPLSVAGSLRSYPGGRFNIGNLEPVYFPPFPALYLAVDASTALQELLCQDKHSESGLTNMDFALQKTGNFSVVAVSFRLDRVLDLRKISPFRELINLTKNFKIPTGIKKLGKELRIKPPPSIIKDPKLLRDNILDANWRVNPMFNDVPANSQVLGQMVQEAGIEGIIYPSKMTKKDSIAIFTRNFAKGESWVQLEGSAPKGVISRIDSTNWKIAEDS